MPGVAEGSGADRAAARIRRTIVDVDETTPPAAAWWQLQRTFFALRLTLRRRLAPAGIALAHAEALAALQAPGAADAESAPMTVTRLARTLHLEPHTLTALVDEVEQRGWVQRHRDLPDRRAVRLELTAAGTAKATDAQRCLNEALVQCFAGLEADEVRTLVALLARVGP